ncbi:MAG: glycosyltransferase family 4 protein [Chloroflexi bacterium]|nr:glycosyltransferase family 4 protein [Chloroflexota bacterium]
MEATSSAFHGSAGEPILVIPNGIDLATYIPRQGLTPRGVRPRSERDLVLLWPHRPDERKGVTEAIRITADLTSALPQRNVRLLVPRHVDAASSAETREFYDHTREIAAAAGVAGSLEFTPWWTGEEMAHAYSYADVTLCPGNFIESFSLAAYESLACGTPVVAASVGALRDLPDHPDVHMFPHGDAESAREASLAASAGMTDPNGIRMLLSEKYSFDEMQRSYANAILSAETLRVPRNADAAEDFAAPVQRGPGAAPASSSSDRFSLAPWCYVAGERVYNDYEYGWSQRPELASFLARLDKRGTGIPGFTRTSAIEAGVSHDQFEDALRDGVIVRA